MAKGLELKNRATLKQEAKSTVKINTTYAVLLTAIAAFIVNLCSTLPLKLSDDLLGKFKIVGVVSVFAPILNLIIISVFFNFLDWFRTQTTSADYKDGLFVAFSKKYFGGTIIISYISAILILLWSLLLIIPGIVKSLAYSQAQLIFKDHIDNGESDVKMQDCITESRKLMNGHKWDLFVLNLSFMGWWILGIFTFGILYLWVVPYYRMTLVNFYDDLAKKEPDYNKKEVNVFN